MKKENFSFVKGDTFVKGFTPDVNQEIQEIYFTVKETSSDKNYVIQKTLTTGILKDPNTTNRYVVKLRPEDTNDLKVNYDYVYDIQVVTTAMKKTIMGGYLTLEDWDITSSINEDVDVTIDEGGLETYVLPVASENTLGGIKVGANLTIEADGTLNASASSSGGNVDLSGYAKKSELHSHNNKTILDGISQTNINNWNNKSNFSGNYADLTNKPTIPTKTSQLVNDSSYVNETYVTNAINNAQLGGNGENVDLSNYATKDELHSHSNKTVLDSITQTNINTWNSKSNFSGSYNDLTNKPTIPTIPTNISAFTNDSGYITKENLNVNDIKDITSYLKTDDEEISYIELSELPAGVYYSPYGSSYGLRCDGTKLTVTQNNVTQNLVLVDGILIHGVHRNSYGMSYLLDYFQDITRIYWTTSGSPKVSICATEEYVTSAINNAIGTALGGSY